MSTLHVFVLCADMTCRFGFQWGASWLLLLLPWTSLAVLMPSRKVSHVCWVLLPSADGDNGLIGTLLAIAFVC